MYRAAELDSAGNLAGAARATRPEPAAEMPDKLFAWLYRETLREVQGHERRVREGKQVEEALNFSKFVLFSGIVQILKAHSDAGRNKIDGAHLQWRCEELERACNEYWKSKNRTPSISLTELEAINRKLDVIAAHVAREWKS